ncbi:MAG TPA: HAMP domain-containing sensor histidine kinase, partial [Acidobacteriota bacterium]|nr:HAMP domain-containing sensor histidine kinase [Acidobacteriota bacterium]
FAVSQRLLADHLMSSLLSPQSECACSLLLPESLSEIENIGTAASVVVRDASGQVALSSGPILHGISSAGLVRTPLGQELPFPGWTVEVAIRPQIIKGLLPSPGLPIWALALLGTVVAAAALLGVRSLRRSEELLRLQENFVSNVSHELKTPLSKIRLFNELLDPNRGERRKAGRYRSLIDRECRRLSLLVDNVLRLSEPRPPNRLDRFSAGEVAERALETFRAADDPERERFSLQCSDQTEVEGDEALLQQVVMNLLDNAVKYSPAGSPIFLRVAKVGSGVRIEVEDHGPGIPAHHKDRIFEKFYRIEGGDDQSAAGSGLGLALVRHHVESHGGTVEVAAGTNGGSLFIVELPAASHRASQESGCGEGEELTPVRSSA